MLTTGRPATIPANATTPSPAARTEVPTAPARSTPRWPGPYACGGASKGRATTRSASGAVHRATVGGGPSVAAVAADGVKTLTRISSTARWLRTKGSSARTGAVERAAGDLWNGRNAGENHVARSRMLSGAARPDGSTSRVLLPPVQAGQSPPRSQRATAGGVAPLDARAAHHPVPAATEMRGPPAARREEGLQWQSSA